MMRRYVVVGAVQGVGFRWFVARHARTLGLSGYARNLPDGTVEVVVSGDEEPGLTQLEALLRAGPASASVSRVDREELAEGKTLPGIFDIL